MKYKNLLLALFSILISLSLVELFLYFDNKNFYEPIFYNKKLANKNFILNTTAYSEPRTDKIVLFGDSFMMGKKCGSVENLPAIISRDVSNKYEVINFGQPGVNSIQVFSNIKLYLENEKKPKFIIVGFYSNDIHMDKSYCNFIDDLKDYKFIKKEDLKKLKKFCSKKNYSDLITKPNWHKLGITQVLNEAIVKVLSILEIKPINSRNKFYSDLQNLDTLENKLLRYSVIKIDEILEEYNVKKFMFFFPNAENLNINSNISNSYKNLINDLESNFNIKIFNGYEFFNISSNRSMTASLLDKHSDCEYYKIIYEYLKNNNLIFVKK